MKLKHLIGLGILIFSIPTISFARSRKSIEMYGHASGGNVEGYAEQPMSIANQLDAQSSTPNAGQAEQEISGGGGFQFSLLWPTRFWNLEMGMSVGGGRGPNVLTRLEDLTDGYYEDEVDSDYFRYMFQVEKHKWIKAFDLALRAGVGFIHGHVEHSVKSHPNFTNVLPFKENRDWNGLSAEIMPSVGLGDGRHELRFGLGWRHFPKTPSMPNTPRLGSSHWSGTISYLW